jgi:hypothetical protein
VHEALRGEPITFVSRGIHSATFGQSAINDFAGSGNGVGPAQQEEESNMIKKLLGAAAIAAAAFALAPAQAAGVGCNGAGFAKTESAIESMADGAPKMDAQKEIAAAQDAMLNGKGGCASHLNKAMRDTAAK